MKRLFPMCVFVVLAGTAFGRPVVADDISTTELDAPEVGWTCRYPSDWHVMSDEEITALEDRGREAVEAATGGTVVATHRYLLYLKKDDNNLFAATIDPYDPAYGPYETQLKESFEVMLETYRAAGITLESDISTAKIDGIEFTTQIATLFKPGTDSVLLNYQSYDRLFSNGIIFTISMNWDDEEHRATMQEILDSSRFSLRD